MFNFIKKSPYSKVLVPADKVNAMFKSKRIQVFAAVSFGYAGCYIVRNVFKTVSPYIMDEYGLTKTDIGLIMSSMGIAYGLSKFVLGPLSDKCNPKYYLSIGLGLSVIFNALVGTTGDKNVMLALMVLQGIAQGMAGPTCHKSLAEWFAKRERGTIFGVWSASHNVGGALVAPMSVMSIAIATYLGMEQFKLQFIFVIPSIVSALIVVIILFCGSDSPESIGLPQVEQYKPTSRLSKPVAELSEEDAQAAADHEHSQAILNRLSENVAAGGVQLKDMYVKYVLKNKLLWVLGFSEMFIYAVRFGILDWVPVYLTEQKGFGKETAMMFTTVFEIIAILGSVFIGIVTDKFTKGRRAIAGAVCFLLVVPALLVYWQSQNIVVIAIAIGALGLFIYASLTVVVFLEVELVPPFAVGSATGFISFFAYIFGETAAGWGVAQLEAATSWDTVYTVMIFAALLCAVCFFIIAKGEGKKRIWVIDEEKKMEAEKANA